MAIQLPDQLDVGRQVRVRMIDPAPMDAVEARAGQWVPVPVHGRAEVQAPMPEEIEPSLADPLGLLEHMSFDLRPAAAERRHDLLALAEGREETRRRALTEPCQQLGRRGHGRLRWPRNEEAREPAIVWDADLPRDAYSLRPRRQPLSRSQAQLRKASPPELRPHREPPGGGAHAIRPSYTLCHSATIASGAYFRRHSTRAQALSRSASAGSSNRRSAAAAIAS